MRTWRAGMARLGTRNIGLDGVLAQQDNYRKSGFALAYRNVRYQGAAPRPASPPPGLQIASLGDIAFAALAAYERPLFPVPRETFLRCWIAQPGSIGRAAIRDGAPAGYGVIRPCQNGFKIGPLFADDPSIAEALFVNLASSVGAGPVFLDTPEPNRAAVALAERHGMTPVFETARMYTKGAPAVDLGRVFGVTTFELG
jgi:hypothetical protein